MDERVVMATAAADLSGEAGGKHYMDWQAILAGAVVASAIFLVLTTFGGAIGLSLTATSAIRGTSLVGQAVAVGLWTAWVAISAFMTGGYVAGRMRRRLGEGTAHESEVHDGMHGLAVWGAGVLLGALLASSIASGVARTAAMPVTSAATDEYAIGGLFRGGPRQSATPAAEETNRQISAIIAADAGLSALPADDFAYIAAAVQRQTGLSEQDSQARANRFFEERKEAMTLARKVGVIVGFLTAASLALSALGAWRMAALGGKHRNEGTVISGLSYW